MPAISRLRASALGKLIIVLLAVAALGPVAPGAHAAVFGTQGLSTRAGIPQAEVDRATAQAASTGAKVVRLEADWAALEPTSAGLRDPAAVDALDRVVASAARRGMRTILFFDRTPCWASAAPDEVRGACTGPDANRSDVWRYRPRDPASATPIATFLAARYAKHLAAFQIWNEPDQANEKYWAGSDKVETYSALVRSLYRPLKQAAPKVPVIAGSFVGSNGRWLEAMYRQGVKGFYDGLAVQFYGPTLLALRATRAVQRAHGDRKPLWLTEFGYTTCYRAGGPAVQFDQRCVTRAAAARGITDVLTALAKRPFVAAAVQFALVDDAPGGYTFGFFDGAGRAKPAFAAVRRVVTHRSRRPYRPTARVRIVGDHAVVTGTASLTELVSLRVEVAGALRLRARFTVSPLGRWEIPLPASFGSRRIVALVSAGWTGSVSARR